MSEPLVCIHNRHSEDCGSPPSINDIDSRAYFGYFEGACGDQWILTVDRKTHRAQLRGGDVGWDRVFDVQDGKVDDLILSPEESRWLTACWSAAVTGLPSPQA